jgi:hypothetical protein
VAPVWIKDWPGFKSTKSSRRWRAVGGLGVSGERERERKRERCFSLEEKKGDQKKKKK